jgi:uncharacterized protein
LTTATPAADIIAQLGLEPHPEGGHFREVYRHQLAGGGRGDCTSIYFLLAEGERSAWHRVDAVEVWHWYAGAPLELTIAEPGREPRVHLLGNDLATDQRPQAVVPPFAWQTAVSTGAWTLVGCTVAPAFRFEGFELAPEGWEPQANEASAPVNYGELESAFEFVSCGYSGENRAYIARDTGSIHYRSDLAEVEDEDDGVDPEDDTSDRFIAIPPKNDLDLGRALVFRFAEEALPNHDQEIYAIFRKRGAYGRFKDLLAREGMLERWYAFEAKAQERALRDWCEENGIPIADADEESSP